VLIRYKNLTEVKRKGSVIFFPRVELLGLTSISIELAGGQNAKIFTTFHSKNNSTLVYDQFHIILSKESKASKVKA
jgi:hypothetical protein